MKKCIAIFFLIVFFTAATELHQLVKLPNLVRHYIEHNSEKPTTLLAFFIVHYASGDIKDADYEKDLQLPFKSLEHCEFTIIVIHSLTSIVTVELPPVIYIPKRYTLYSQNFISSDLSANIWQPPKA